MVLGGLATLFFLRFWHAEANIARPDGTRLVSISFRGPEGSHDTLIVAMPAWYGPQRHPRLPLVISPHSRGVTASANARRWGGIPGRFGLIVLNPGLHGRIIKGRSWAWPAEVSETVDLLGVVRRSIPYLRYDPDRVYAIGHSMGGQEALMDLVHQPDVFAAVVAVDPVTNFVDRWYDFPHSALSKGQQRAATQEVGSTPRRKPWLYVQRSPLFFARTIAFSAVAVQLWWNPKDTVVITEGRDQAGALYRTVRRLNPRAPIYDRIHHEMHGYVFRYDRDLPEMVRFLRRFRRHGPPAHGFSYESWSRSASVWGWDVRAGAVRRKPWRLDFVTRLGFRSVSPVMLRVRPPVAPVAAFVDGRRVPVKAGAVRVLAGRHDVRLVP